MQTRRSQVAPEGIHKRGSRCHLLLGTALSEAWGWGLVEDILVHEEHDDYSSKSLPQLTQAGPLCCQLWEMPDGWEEGGGVGGQ